MLRRTHLPLRIAHGKQAAGMRLCLLCCALFAFACAWFTFDDWTGYAPNSHAHADMNRAVDKEVAAQSPTRRLVTLSGRVIDPRGRAIAGVQVLVPDNKPALTNTNGEFKVTGITPTERLAVSFSSTNFMNYTRIFKAEEKALQRTQIVVLWPRAKAVTLDAARGGKVRFSTGGGLTLAPNSLVDSKGQPLRGKVMISLTNLDVSNREQLKRVPGDFTARMSDKSIRMLESFGVFEINATDARGRRADLAPGKSARFELPIARALRERAPKRSKLFSFDTSNGQWVEEGEVVLTEQLVYSGTINRFDWDWNVDNPLDTTCITVKFVDVYGSNAGPIANALVEATGVNYSTISSGYTNSAGLVCLLVKINSPILITGYDPPGNPIGPVNVTSPNVVSGAGDCGNPTLCPVITTVEQDARLIFPNTDPVKAALSRFVHTHVSPNSESPGQQRSKL